MNITNTELAALVIEVQVEIQKYLNPYSIPQVKQKYTMLKHKDVIELASLLRRADINSHYAHIIQLTDKCSFVEKFTKIGPNRWTFNLPREAVIAK